MTGRWTDAPVGDDYCGEVFVITISHQPPEPGKDLGKNSNLKTPVKSQRINGPCVIKRAHNPKVVSSNLTPATNC